MNMGDNPDLEAELRDLSIDELNQRLSGLPPKPTHKKKRTKRSKKKFAERQRANGESLIINTILAERIEAERA